MLAGLGAGTSQAATLTNCANLAALTSAVAAGVNLTFNCDGTIVLPAPLVISNSVAINATAGRQVILSGGSTGRLFVVQAGATLTLSNLTLANGKETFGGAIWNQGTVLATNCAFLNNQAAGPNGANGANGKNRIGALDGANGAAGTPGLGGAIYNSGMVRAGGCLFQGNQATGGSGGAGGNGGADAGWPGDGGDGADGAPAYGGAFYSEGGLRLGNCTFSTNTVTGGSGGAGGTGGSAGHGGAGAAACGAGLWNAGAMTLNNCTFANNAVRGGSSANATTKYSEGLDGPPGASSFGGACYNTGAGTAINCTFFANTATGGAGGNGGPGSWGDGNGGDGGAAWGGTVFNSGQLSLTNCTVSDGSATGGANGLAGGATGLASNGRLGASKGGNLAASGGALQLKNSLVAYALSGDNGWGAITDLGHNLSSDASLALSAAGSRNSVDPKLGLLANNGGATATLALLGGSPAIDGADSTTSPALDQRGLGRCGAGPDIGAYELQAGTIRGWVKRGSQGVGGVMVACSDQTLFTPANGYFEFAGLPPGTYTVTPTLDNTVFTPASATVSVWADVNVNFSVVVPRPSLTILRTNATLLIRGAGAAGQVYSLEAATTWSQTTNGAVLNWTSVASPAADANGKFEYQETHPTNAFRVFRARQ
jgi:hypothetical protein